MCWWMLAIYGGARSKVLVVVLQVKIVRAEPIYIALLVLSLTHVRICGPSQKKPTCI